jgi:hypothetical protein
MSLTKAETWSVRSKVEAVRKAAAKFGLTVTEVGEVATSFTSLRTR